MIRKFSSYRLFMLLLFSGSLYSFFTNTDIEQIITILSWQLRVITFSLKTLCRPIIAQTATWEKSHIVYLFPSFSSYFFFSRQIRISMQSCNAIFLSMILLLLFFLASAVRGISLRLYLCFYTFLLAFFLWVYCCSLIDATVSNSLWVSFDIYNFRMNFTKQVSSLSLNYVNLCRMLNTDACNIFCWLLFYITLCVVVKPIWINWFPCHFLRTFARVPEFGLNARTNHWTVYPGYNKGPTIVFILYIVLLCNNAIWAVWKTLCVPIS